MWMSSAMREYPEADGLLHSGLRSPVMALELAPGERELASVLGRARGDEARIADMFRQATRIDLAFIPVYAMLLVSFVGIVFDGGGAGWAGVRRVAVTLILAAAAADYAENWGIFQALDAPSLDSASAARIRLPAIGKWGLLFGVAAIAAIGLIARGGRTPFGPVAARLAGIGLLGGVALAVRATQDLSFLERAVTLCAGAVLPACLMVPLIRRK